MDDSEAPLLPEMKEFLTLPPAYDESSEANSSIVMPPVMDENGKTSSSEMIRLPPSENAQQNSLQVDNTDEVDITPPSPILAETFE